MKKRLLAIVTLMLAVMLVSTAVFASNKTVPMQKKALDVPYEEVSVADQIGFTNTGMRNVRHGAALVNFDFIGLGEQKGERTLMVSVDSYNVVDWVKNNPLFANIEDGLPAMSHEITCAWDASLDMFGKPVWESYDINGKTFHQLWFVWNHDRATMRVIIREGNDILGYALINFSDMNESALTPEPYGGYANFSTFEVVKAVMFMKDGEPYRGVTMDEVNALLDEAAISANKAENAGFDTAKVTEDDSVLPEDDAENKGDDAVTSENTSKITENDPEGEIEGEGETETEDEGEPEAEPGDNAGKIEDDGEDEDTPISSSRRDN